MSELILNSTEFDNVPFPLGFEGECSALAAQIGELLTGKGMFASAAESLTGGLISSEIVRAAGASKWFYEGCVTYSSEAKIKRLGVERKLIESDTAVSAGVAMQMASGLITRGGADIAVSATGLAGPGPDELGRPAGLVYIGGACRFGCAAKRLCLTGDRTEIRRQAAYAALRLLLKLARL